MACPECTFNGPRVSNLSLIRTLDTEKGGKQFLNYSLFSQQPEQLQIKSAKEGYINTVEIFLSIIIFSCHVEVEL